MTNYYFAYGSNVNHADWQRWCANRGASADGLRAECLGFLPDHEICFNYFSISRNGGALNIVERPGHAVRGLIMRADDETWDLLDQKEGAGSRYEQVDLTAVDEVGRDVPVTTYRVTQEHETEFVAPRRDYLNVVERGFADRGVPLPRNVAQAAAGETVASLVSGFFVYGTLREGECRRGFLEQHGPLETAPATTAGELFDLGPYPGMRYIADAASQVVGEHINTTALTGTVATLDDIEGFHGFGVTGSWFRRTVVRVNTGQRESRHAWAYEYSGSVAEVPRIKSGDWFRRD